MVNNFYARLEGLKRGGGCNFLGKVIIRGEGEREGEGGRGNNKERHTRNGQKGRRVKKYIIKGRKVKGRSKICIEGEIMEKDFDKSEKV